MLWVFLVSILDFGVNGKMGEVLWMHLSTGCAFLQWRLFFFFGDACLGLGSTDAV